MKTIAVLLSFALSFAVYGQSRAADSTTAGRTTLTGVVYDINGSVIVNGTKIVARDKAGKEYATATNDEGVYRFDLPIATYRIVVVAPGFCDERVDRFRIVNSTYGKMSLDFVLEVANGQPGCKHESSFEKKPNRRLKVKPNVIVE